MPSLRIPVPAELKDQVRAWARESGRSMSAEVIAVLQAGLARRKAEAELARQLKGRRRQPPIS